jgi:WD40 repeat protein
MNQSTGSPLSDPKAVHERIARALATHADQRSVAISQIHVYARRHLPEHAAAGESMSESISCAILPYLDVAALKEASSSAELPFMPLVRKAAHAWSWEHPGRNAAALRFIAAAEQYDIGEPAPRTPWRVPWAKPVGASEILAKVDSLLSLGAARLNGRIVIITASRDGRVLLWDLASGQSAELCYQPAGVSAVAAESAADGSVFVSISNEGRVRCWQVREFNVQPTAQLKAAEQPSFNVGAPVTALSVTLINSWPQILAGQVNGKVSLLDWKEENQPWVPPAHGGRVTGVTSVRLATGMPAAVSVSLDGSLRVWSLRERLVALTSRVPAGSTIKAVVAVRFPDGTPAAVTAGGRGSVRVWDLPPEDVASREVPGHDRDGDVVMLAAETGRRGQSLVVTGDSNGSLRIVDPTRAMVVSGPVDGHRARITGLALSGTRDGRRVAISGGGDETVRTWDLDGAFLGGPPDERRPDGMGAAPPGTAPAPASDREQPVRLWRLADGRELGRNLGARSHRMTAVAVCRLADGTEAAVTDPGGPPRDPGQRGPIVAVAAAALPDGRTVAITANDVCLRFWELSPELAPRLMSHRSAHPGVRLVVAARRADDRLVAVSAGRDHVLRMWDIQDGKRLDSGRAEHAKSVTALAAVTAPDRPAVVVSGSTDTTLRVWSVDSGQRVGSIVRGSRREITAVAAAYTDSGMIAVTARREDWVVQKWGLLGERDPGPPTLTGHEGPVTAIAIAGPPERPVLVTASEDRTVRVWDLLSAELIVDPMPVPGTVRAIACFDADGPSAVIAGDDVLAVVRWDGHAPRPADPGGGHIVRHRPGGADGSMTSPAGADGQDKDKAGITITGTTGVQVGDGNLQINNIYFLGNQPWPGGGQTPAAP